MLAFLRVKNFAIIDELEIEFKEGLNVITGETGAGKSIIINALAILMSSKTPSDVVKNRSQPSEVTGHYCHEYNEYVLRRTMSPQGRSRAYVNESPVTLKRLEELGSSLVSIYGQNESQDLRNKDNYVSIIDVLLSLDRERRLLADKVRDLREVDEVLAKKRGEVEGREKEIDLLEFQINEIERADLKDGEDATAKERLMLLKELEKVSGVLDALRQGFYEDDNSVLASLKSFASLAKSVSHVEAMEKIRSRIESIAFDVEDVVDEIKREEKNLFYDPEEAMRLEDRLVLIYRLKEKYGKTFKEIKDYHQWATNHLSYLMTLTTNIEELEKKREEIAQEVWERASFLSNERKKGAQQIEAEIVAELALLSMPKVQFKITVVDKDTIDDEGRDDIDFLMSANPGEELKPLRRVASGGELSRIMLAVKKVVGGVEGTTMIFDEIDAGIGGAVAEMVGRRLKELAAKGQVICITHLPQIAVYGDHHYLVEKVQEEESTRTGIRLLEADERVVEVARMLGGVNITEKTLERAEEMLQNAEESLA